MLDLFKDIPEEKIHIILNNIKKNLECISLYEGHAISRHVDKQVLTLKKRITEEGKNFATSFYDIEKAQNCAIHLLKKSYEGRIVAWLLSLDDLLIVKENFNIGVGYGYQRATSILYEELTKVRMVLEKDEKRPWGFRIVTFYPTF